jgi:predicted transglutaminase-like cysteine proteinase
MITVTNEKLRETIRPIVDTNLNFEHTLTNSEYVRLADKCMQDLIDVDMPINTNINFVINSRAKRRFGQCRKLPLYESREKGYEYEIEISNELIKKGINIKAFKETVYHELIHTVPGCMNHGIKFKQYIHKVNALFNTNIGTTSTYEKLGIANEDEIKGIKYIIKCEKCNHLHKRSKKTKFITHYNHYTCGCGGKLTRIK